MKIFLGISSFQILAMFRRGLFYSYLTIYLRHFLGLSVTATTLFATIPMIVNVVSQRYIWGVLSDRYQKRRLLIIWGELLGGIGTILLWYTHIMTDNRLLSGYIIIAGLSVIELFWSMSNIGWSALISDIYDQGTRSSIMGKLESLGGVGRIFGVLSGGFLYDGFGHQFDGWGFYHGSLFFISAAAMFISILPMLMVPEGGIKPQIDHPDQTIISNAYNPVIFIVFIIAMAFINFGRNSVSVTLAQYLTLPSGLNLSSMMLSHIVNIRSVAIVLTGIFTGILTRKLGPGRFLVSGALISVLSLVILGYFEDLFLVSVGSFFMGMSEVVIMAASYELASIYIPPEKRARLFSIFNATYFLSWGIAATCIAGPITDILIKTGRSPVFAYKVSFNVAAAMTFSGILVLGLLFLLTENITSKKTIPITNQ